MRYFLLALILVSNICFAQDSLYTRKTLKKLTAKTFWGRGYTKNGMAKAADFIEKEFKSFGLQPINNDSYRQEFTFSVNTFPNKMDLKINGKKLLPGKDFIIHQASRGNKANGDLQQKDSLTFVDPVNNIIINLVDKLTWSVAQKVNNFTQVFVKKSAITSLPETFEINVENKFIPDFKAANIGGIIKGTKQPDSVIFITAHYDHLGGMGNKVYFPGANDNASGVSFLLSLAKYYAANPQPYSIGFICFAGEEAGILGSKYFTENPLVPLKQIRFLFNIDMVGTGDAGATVVNATLHPKEFAVLNQINAENKFLVKINPRGKAANSDHYFFTEKGVPAFFLYTQGGIPAYHDVLDKAETLPFSVYSKLFKLFIKFNSDLMN